MLLSFADLTSIHHLHCCHSFLRLPPSASSFLHLSLRGQTETGKTIQHRVGIGTGRETKGGRKEKSTKDHSLCTGTAQACAVVVVLLSPSCQHENPLYIANSVFFCYSFFFCSTISEMLRPYLSSSPTHQPHMFVKYHALYNNISINPLPSSYPNPPLPRSQQNTHTQHLCVLSCFLQA